MLYFTTFHAWSTVLKEQVGGLRRVLVSSASGVEEEDEVALRDGNTNLGYQNNNEQ